MVIYNKSSSKFLNKFNINMSISSNILILSYIIRKKKIPKTNIGRSKWDFTLK